MALSCSKKNDDDPVVDVIGGTWNLTSAIGNTKFDYKQTITFKTTDSSFIKTYENGDESKTAKGKFSIRIESRSDTNFIFVSLKYNEISSLIQYCYKEQLREEYFVNQKDSELIGTWGICDGPTYIYNKK
ncbi:MAG: hypothetical protein DI598_03195 [Pseudopedobacter saltans]|uniref:Lipocalin-like domain-containing protein n=1 Tax=Pseudopedobacter saltans TaxID=151895 RepID=A0A2W5F7S9_9SPHI|nr:MAG: hypothetical protein DI598_03195 [Pseudopedobacter saltans]